MQNKSIFLIFLSLFLAGCETIRPSYQECNNRITAIEEGSRVTVRTLENGNTAEARLNGVTALCNEKDEIIKMRIKLGLKVARDTVQSRESVILELPLLIAILNSKDEVKSYESLSFKMAFPENKEVIYPVINTKVEIPNYGRVVISLVSEIIKP